MSDDYQPRTPERLIEILRAQAPNPRSWQAEAAATISRMQGTLHDLEYAFAQTSDIPETPFTLHALDAIRRALGKKA